MTQSSTILTAGRSRKPYGWFHLRFRLELWASLPVLLGLRLLPHAWALALGTLVGYAMYYLSPARRRVGLSNLAVALPDEPVVAHRSVLRRSFSRLGRTVVEILQLAWLSCAQIRRRVSYDPDCAHHLREYQEDLARGQGAILFTGHLGNWELLGLGHSLLGHPTQVLSRRIDNPNADAILEGIRSRGGNTVLGNENDSLAAILGHLKSGGTVGLLADQYPKRSRGVLVPFFGKAVWANRGPALLALRSGAKLYPVYLRRDTARPGHYRIAFEKPIVPVRTGSKDEDIRRLSASIQESLETEIKSRPEDWLWFHRRWKWSPDLPNLYGTSQRRRRRQHRREQRASGATAPGRVRRTRGVPLAS